MAEDAGLSAEIDDDDLIVEFHGAVNRESQKLNAAATTLDIYFMTYLRRFSRFGYFTFGPINIDVGIIEEIVDRTTPRRAPGAPSLLFWDTNFDFVRFSNLLMEEVRRSGRRRIDELHFLLTFMKTDEGLPRKVFGELGVSPDEVEEFARHGGAPQPPVLEKLFSPEQAAAYLDVNVRTVRGWIRSGRLKARRLAGQRALRITASDLQSVLEPVSSEDV